MRAGSVSARAAPAADGTRDTPPAARGRRNARDDDRRPREQAPQEDRRGVADAVVVGAGPNGLVAANLLADRGWDAVVLEEGDEPGGAVRSGELVEPGFTNDLFSGFYPFT